MDTITDLYYRAQDFAQENPYVVLVLALLIFWFVVRPRLCKGLFEGFSGGQSTLGKAGHVAQDEYATSH